MANTFPLVVPVAKVPVVLKLVENVRVKLLVPLVVMTSVACWPAVQFEALMVSAWAGVKVNTVPALKLMATVVPGVSAEAPMPPSVIGTAATVVAHDPEELVTFPVSAGWLAHGRIPVTCVARLTTVTEAIRKRLAAITTSNALWNLGKHQYHRQFRVEPVAGAVK